jgi:general L-amino acid transport system substrate-binding protein
MKMLKSTLAIVTAATVLGVSGFAQAGATLDAVQKKGFVQCGVSDGLPGFSVPDATGKILGIDADVCRAVAAAVFGDATKVKFSQLNAKERFTALQSGEIDILSRNTTMTSSRDAGMGLKYTPITFDTSDESAKSLESGRCDVLTSDKSQLFAQRSKLASPKDYVVLPETISKEPLGPVVRNGDDEWLAIVRWVGYALLNTEEAGITSKNVEAEAKSTKNPDVARMLGADGEYGKDLKLPKDWVVQIVKQVGNYGEIFEKNLGKSTPLEIDRGLNALWNNGGIQYAPPVR